LSKLLEVKEQFEELQNDYQKYLPKVDTDITNHLLTRQSENPVLNRIYMLEVFTNEGIDSQKAKDLIFHKTRALLLQ
jgi:DNA-binding ferritin-like protein (Dps family)